MILDIDNHSGVPIYRQIVDQVRRQILADHLSAGDQLVSVRDLARRLKVNPMTVSKAYSLLEMEEFVERRRGVGVFVAEMSRGGVKQTKKMLLEEALERAAVAAIQFDISEEEAVAIFIRLYRRHSSRKAGSRNEQ